MELQQSGVGRGARAFSTAPLKKWAASYPILAFAACAEASHKQFLYSSAERCRLPQSLCEDPVLRKGGNQQYPWPSPRVAPVEGERWSLSDFPQILLYLL